MYAKRGIGLEIKDLFIEPGPQHLWGHSSAHTSAQIFGQSGDWGMSLILGLWPMTPLIGGWGPQQRLGQLRSHLVKHTLGHPAISCISLKRFLVQHGFGHDGRHVWGEQAGATQETGFGFPVVGTAVGLTVERRKEIPSSLEHFILITAPIRKIRKVLINQWHELLRKHFEFVKFV